MYGVFHLTLDGPLMEIDAGLVMELMEAGSLHDLVVREGNLRKFLRSVYSIRKR